MAKTTREAAVKVQAGMIMGNEAVVVERQGTGWCQKSSLVLKCRDLGTN